MLAEPKETILLNLKNIPGWRTKRKILVIECDDFGSIRMPSKLTFDTLYKKGLKVNTSRYNRFDTLESYEDLEQMFSVLTKMKDRNNNSAVITSVTNMANPDFDKIKLSGYTEYFYEEFTKTHERYYPNQDIFRIWNEGIKEGIFIPELHGKEHISVQFWIQKLQEGDSNLLLAFDYGFVSLASNGIPHEIKEFRPEFFFNSADQKPFLVKSIEEGVELYKKIFW